MAVEIREEPSCQFAKRIFNVGVRRPRDSGQIEDSEHHLVAIREAANVTFLLVLPARC